MEGMVPVEKLPPAEKVYEAWTAVEDGHARLGDDGATCTVVSSDGARRYTVRRETGADGREVYRSNDNATYWQGYAGYPVIAMLMLEGRVPLDLTVAGWFAGVDWHAVNAAHKGDHAAAVAAVEAGRGLKKERVTHARQDAEKVLDALAALDIEVGRNGVKVERLG